MKGPDLACQTTGRYIRPPASNGPLHERKERLLVVYINMLSVFRCTHDSVST